MEEIPMSKTTTKSLRILSLYDALRSGRAVGKKEMALQFGIDERSVQRDIDELRAYLAERSAQAGGRQEIVYDRQKKGFVLTDGQSPLMSNSEILAVSKILLESRAFKETEMFRLLDKLVSGCAPAGQKKLVSDLLANEKFHYVQLTHPAEVQDTLWAMGDAIQKHELVELTYRRQDVTQPAVKRVVEPASILFSEYYFYLNAYIVEPDPAGKYVHKYDYPAIFRVDRIVACKKLGIQFHLPYSSRFQEGEFRKRVQFMYPGDLLKLRFRYSGASVEAVLDRLPTAKVLAQEEAGTVIEAEVYGKGILMWLLSQGKSVEILAPKALREEMRNTLSAMLKFYEAD